MFKKNKKLTKKFWGTIELLGQGDYYRVDKITIFPSKGDKIHMQPSIKHTCYVVEGVGQVTVGPRDHILQTADIKAGDEFIVNQDWLHRYKNAGKKDLVIIQCSYGKFDLDELVNSRK